MKNRDCNNMWPMYGMPYVGPMMPMDNYPDNSFQNQIKSLEKRVSNLEAIVGNNYNNNGYQMM